MAQTERCPGSILGNGEDGADAAQDGSRLVPQARRSCGGDPRVRCSRSPPDAGSEASRNRREGPGIASPQGEPLNLCQLRSTSGFTTRSTKRGESTQPWRRPGLLQGGAELLQIIGLEVPAARMPANLSRYPAHWLRTR